MKGCDSVQVWLQERGDKRKGEAHYRGTHASASLWRRPYVIDFSPFLKHAPIVTCPNPTLLWGGFYSHATETAASRLSRYTREAYRSKQAIDARLAQLIVAHTVRRP